MKNFSGTNNVYLIGIGGIGMSGLARYFHRMGKQVAGYDRTPSALTKELESEGIQVHYEDDVNLIPEQFMNDRSLLLIYTPAVPKDHSELNYFIGKGIIPKKRSQVLGDITEDSFTVAIGGTHGKTTTTTLVAHILKTAGYDMAAFLGGISANYETNFLLGDKNKYVVVEADEFDRSFLTLHPDIAVITSVDPDHLDIYGDDRHVKESYDAFAKRVKENGHLILSASAEKAVKAEENVRVHTYSLRGDTDCRSEIQESGRFSSTFLFTGLSTSKQFELGIAGIHNVENATAAIAAALLLRIDPATIDQALKTFKGVRRRFEYHIKRDDLVFIDDYAHHPEELKAFISSTKKIFPGKKLTGIFQPHLFTRTRDFADEFAEVLDMLDEPILLDIYPARELPIEGVTSSMLKSRMKNQNTILLSKEALLDHLRNERTEVVMTMGAGDIELLVEPIKKILEEKK